MYAIGDYTDAVDEVLDRWEQGSMARRLWERDASLWTGGDEDRWLGWLTALEARAEVLPTIGTVAGSAQAEDFRHLLLLGMGGSSLCPDVLGRTFGRLPGWPELSVLDSTDPAQVHRIEQQVDLARTLCVVASKSGSTTEPNAFCDYFLHRMRSVVGEKAGSHFVAITDPGSQLEARAAADGFRHTFAGVPNIGGRFSALSNFGLVPAGMMGLDLDDFVSRAQTMVDRCGPDVPANENPGVVLGVILGELARLGRDKVTLVVSPGIRTLGAWLEQLLAESTGKHGVGLVPVDLEPQGQPVQYGPDRIFVYTRLESGVDEGQEAFVSALRQAEQPVITIPVRDPMDLGAEFFRWEVATAVAGAVLGINPFDQPNVQESKDFTSRLTQVFEAEGALPAEEPVKSFSGARVFASGANEEAISDAGSLSDVIASHLSRTRAGDYVALCAFIDMSESHQRALADVRRLVLDRRTLPTTLGFGPRFLHSTGQLHKGGADNGVYIQITADDAADLPLPDRRLTFGALKGAQALGDFQALSARGRRVIRIHLDADTERGLADVRDAVEQALS